MALNFQVASNPYEDMDILLIGAAPPPVANRPGNERQYRMFISVKRDIQRMYDRCSDHDFLKSPGSYRQKPVGHLNVRLCLLNHKQLAPAVPSDWQRLDRTDYFPAVYNSVETVRHNVRQFIESQEGPNLMIYFSGHGTYDQGYGAGSSARRLQESLTIPVHVDEFDHRGYHQVTRLQQYTASQLTDDISRAMRRRIGNDYERCDAKVFVVIDACHAGGLVNMWSLAKSARLRDFVVLFAGAETQLDADFQDGGKFTNVFLKHFRKGIKLSDLDERVLEELYEPDKRAPCVRYSHPSLCDQLLLKRTVF